MHNKVFIHEEHEGHEVVCELYHAIYFSFLRDLRVLRG